MARGSSEETEPGVDDRLSAEPRSDQVDPPTRDETSKTSLDSDTIGDQTFPIAGRLMWIPPGGPPREIKPAELQFDDVAPAEETARSCPECGAEKSIETIVREHVDCGYVGVDGFVEADGEGLLACPKCGAEEATGDRFDIVATVYSCIYCGQTLDQPLSRNGREP